MPDYQVSAPGFEPGTVCLEGRCSIQLSYAPLCVKFSNFRWKMFTVIFKKTVIFQTVFFVGVAGFEPATSWSQTRRDDRTTLHPEVNRLRRVWDSNPRDTCASTV